MWAGVKWQRGAHDPETWGDGGSQLGAAAAGRAAFWTPGAVSHGEPIPLWHAGCIANRAELLAQTGLPPGAMDAQILCALYERFGSSAAGRIAGQFAWILWDAPRHILVAARDRLGTQGLYYAERGDTLWVSGDLEALLAQVPGPHRLSLRSAIAQIHALTPAAGETFYEGIAAVEPGGWLEATTKGISRHSYWRMEAQPELRLPSDAEYAEAYRALLLEVVRGYVAGARMGVTLSSGMDSTSVAAAIKAVVPTADLTALTWTTPELPAAEEYPLAGLVAARLGLPQLTLRADLNWTLCTPEGLHTDRGAPFLLYYEEAWDVTHQAFREHDVEIVFDGMSGDNLFGGNVFVYPDLLLTGRWLRLARELCYHLPRSPLKPTLARAVRTMIISPIAQAYFPFLVRRSPPAPWLRAGQRPLFREVSSRPSHAPSIRMLPGRARRLQSLQDPFLTQVAEHVDRRARTHHGIEMRHPLLDHRLFEFAASLPTTQTFRAGQRKVIVRNAMRDTLPDEIVDMWGKITPETISERGLREREVGKVWALLSGMRAADLGLVDEAALRETYQRYLDGKTSNALFWYTLTLEDWLRRYF
jgi:asparagine synthase (glutamine-hydrolysing)